MDFSDAELRELAVFLARRISPELIPLPGASEERVAAAVQDWERILREARAAGRVPKVLGSAARALPRDLALQEAARLVDPSAPVRSWFAGGLMVVATAALILLTLAGFTTSGVMVAMEAARPVLLAEAELPAEAGAEPAPVVMPSVEDAAPQEAAVAPAPEEPPAVASADPTDAPTDAHGALPAKRLDGRAPETSDRGAPGAAGALRIPGVEDMPAQASKTGYKPVDTCPKGGWVYAGRSRPEGTFVAAYHLRVRSAPPSKDNGWNSSTPVRCYLQKGDIVRMAQPALELPNHHFWVYVAPGSVERPDGVALNTRRAPGQSSRSQAGRGQ